MMSYIVFIKSKRLPCYWVLFILQLVCMRGALYCDCHDDGRSTIWSSEVRVGIKWRTSSQRRSHNQGQHHHLRGFFNKYIPSFGTKVFFPMGPRGAPDGPERAAPQDSEVPWCCPSRSEVRHPSRFHGTNFEIKIVKFRWFLGPSSRNQLYTQLLSKI